MPSLLEEGDQKVKGHVDVLSELFVGKVLSSHGDGKAGNLLQLELNGRLDAIDLNHEGLVVRHNGGEHLNSVKDWSKDDWDLLDEDISGEEHGVLLGPLLD